MHYLVAQNIKELCRLYIYLEDEVMYFKFDSYHEMNFEQSTSNHRQL